MLTLKDTNLPLPTNAEEVSYAAFEAYREGNLLRFFQLQTGANSDLFPDMITPYAAACAGLIMHCVQMAETPRQSVVFNDKVWELPDDLGDAKARQFWAHSLASDDIEALCAYIGATREEVEAAPYYVVRQLLLFFSALQSSCERFLKLSQAFPQAKKRKQPDLSHYQIGTDGVVFSPRSLAHSSTSNLN